MQYISSVDRAYQGVPKIVQFEESRQENSSLLPTSETVLQGLKIIRNTSESNKNKKRLQFLKFRLSKIIEMRKPIQGHLEIIFEFLGQRNDKSRSV